MSPGAAGFAAAASWVISITVTMPCCLAKERLLARVPTLMTEWFKTFSSGLHSPVLN